MEGKVNNGKTEGEVRSVGSKYAVIRNRHKHVIWWKLTQLPPQKQKEKSSKSIEPTFSLFCPGWSGYTNIRPTHGQTGAVGVCCSCGDDDPLCILAKRPQGNELVHVSCLPFGILGEKREKRSSASKAAPQQACRMRCPSARSRALESVRHLTLRVSGCSDWTCTRFCLGLGRG